MRVSYYYFLAGVRPASHPLTVSIFAFIIRSIWVIGHVLEIHLHFVVNNCEFFIIHNNSKNILTGFPVFIHFCLLLLYCLIHRCQLCCLVCCDQAVNDFIQISVHNAVQLMKRKLDSVIGHTSLWEVVSTDLLRTVSCTDLASSCLSLCRMLLLQFQVILFGTQKTKCLFLVLQL